MVWRPTVCHRYGHLVLDEVVPEHSHKAECFANVSVHNKPLKECAVGNARTITGSTILRQAECVDVTEVILASTGKPGNHKSPDCQSLPSFFKGARRQKVANCGRNDSTTERIPNKKGTEQDSEVHHQSVTAL